MIAMPVSDQNWIAKRILHFFWRLPVSAESEDHRLTSWAGARLGHLDRRTYFRY